MTRKLAICLIAVAASALGSGCECTRHHLHCLVKGHKYPHSCPPCPYYEPQTCSWRTPVEIYTGVPSPKQVGYVGIGPETVPAAPERDVAPPAPLPNVEAPLPEPVPDP